jgi:hypothetical protein
MPEFISKVQHKTYEKGEFSDEKVRDLDATILLIKNFPYNAERTLTSVELTGPSVTIRDEDMNYMKVGLYFNGKYCVYYLDRDDHLYEYHAPEIDDACNMVRDFFNGQLDLSKFEKHFFNIGNQAHFVNKTFVYSINKVWITLCFLFIYSLAIIVVGGSIGIIIIKLYWVMLFYIFLDILYLQAIYFMTMVFIKARNMSLEISSGKDGFLFGNAENMASYNKENIEAINVYGSTVRSSRIFNIMDIVFKNGSVITVPGMIIDPLTFALKFPTQKTNYVQGYLKGLKAMWRFIH